MNLILFHIAVMLGYSGLLIITVDYIRELIEDRRVRERVRKTLKEIDLNRDKIHDILEPNKAWCGGCGVELEPVRPGKHQHPNTECVYE